MSIQISPYPTTTYYSKRKIYLIKYQSPNGHIEPMFSFVPRFTTICHLYCSTWYWTILHSLRIIGLVSWVRHLSTHMRYDLHESCELYRVSHGVQRRVLWVTCIYVGDMEPIQWLTTTVKVCDMGVSLFRYGIIVVISKVTSLVSVILFIITCFIK
jgi:hypothetical protein